MHKLVWFFHEKDSKVSFDLWALIPDPDDHQNTTQAATNETIKSEQKLKKWAQESINPITSQIQ